MPVDVEDQIDDDEKVRISSNFILHAPPGEFNEVLNDIRVLVCNDTLVKERAFDAICQHNKDQLIPVKLEDSALPVLITHFNDLGNGQFYDPRSRQCFNYDHLRREVSEIKAWEPDQTIEKWRKAFEDACTVYTSEHYKHGVCSVFGAKEDGIIKLTVCTEHHQFQPKNFWNGQWCSVWSVSFTPGATQAEVFGIFKILVHYYEDGNVQLVSSKEVKDSLKMTNELQAAAEFVSIIENAESQYQMALSEDYQVMSHTTFKALRRSLPVTRMKIDWNQILTYNIANVLKRS